MRRYTLLITTIILSFGLLLYPLAAVIAANDFTTDSSVTVNMSGLGIDLTIDSGAQVDSMTVNSSTIDLTMSANSTIVIRSANNYNFAVSGLIDERVSRTCSPSALTITFGSSDPTTSGTITPSTSTCVVEAAGGGGGGGAPAPVVVVTPSSTSISIAAGAAETRTRSVTLTLAATNAAQMMLSNQSDFAGASWETYATSKAWTLTEGVGLKTVYVKFKSSSGGISSAVSDTISLVSPLPEPKSANVTVSQGGEVALADNSARVSLPADALSGDGSVSISPTTAYTAPSVGMGVAGSQAFNLTAEVAGAAVTTFLKEVTLTFKYTDEQVKGLKESTLVVGYYDEAEKKWVSLGGTIDAAGNTITVKTTHFTLFALIGEVAYSAGDLVKLECDGTNQSICTAVYYLGNDGKRYVFPNEKIYFSWYADYSAVKTITLNELAGYRIGGNVTYRPGVRMVKITTAPKVYAVAKNGVLRWVKTEAVAEALYGANWNQMIDDLSDAFFFAYAIGDEIASAADYNKTAEKAGSPDINTDKGL